MAFDSKRSVYEIAIEIGGKTKDTLRRATGATKKELDGLEAHASKMDKLIGGIGKFVTAGIVVNTLKNVATSAIDAASEMESYRATLNTVLKDEERAAEMMEWATDFAAHTPFSTGDIVDAVTRLEAYGFKSQTMMENIGNMASAMNKDLPTAVEAVYKATLGEMELMENNFAITKKLIGEKSQEWYGQAAVTAQGAIANAELYNNTLLRLIEEKFEGGMERQSKTWMGIKSNMEDSKDAILRKIIGMDASGEATETGAYGKFLAFMDSASKKLSDAVESETLSEWADSLGRFADNALPKIESFIKNELPSLVESGGKLASSTGELWTAFDNLMRELNGGRGTVEVATDLGTSVLSGAAQSINGITGGLNGRLTAREAYLEFERGLLGEGNMLEAIRTQTQGFVDLIGQRAAALGLYPSENISLNNGVRSLFYTTPSNNVNVNVTVAPDASAAEIGKTVGDAVLDVITEAQHQAERRKLRPQPAR